MVDFAELFPGHGEATVKIREAGLTAADGFDNKRVTYERCWCLETRTDQADLAWLIVYALRPKVVHMGTPCTKMCVIGEGKLDAATEFQNEFSRTVAVYQAAEGLGASLENPKGSKLVEQPSFVKTFGDLESPVYPWSYYRSEGCQFHLQYPGADNPESPMRKAQFWISNFDLSGIELRCRYPAALIGTSHDHTHIRGTMYVQGEGWKSVAEFSGRYTPEQGTVYARLVKSFCATIERKPKGERPETELRRLAQQSKVAAGAQRDELGFVSSPASCAASSVQCQSRKTKEFSIRADGTCFDLDTGATVVHTVARLEDLGKERPQKTVDQYHLVRPPDGVEGNDAADPRKSAEYEARAKAEAERHEKEIAKADAYWSRIAKSKDWDTVRADISVYKHTGRSVTEDPRITEEYRQKVVEGLGYGKDCKHEWLTKADIVAVREVLHRKAAAFWIEGTDRTTLRHLLHDTIPTGPPCRTPPHRLRGEEADWVDEQLQNEVLTGQLERGNSEWASPPFATKEFAVHRRQRKRRLVVDYRRVNRRILRAVYYVRNADGVVQEVAGSAFISLVDACKGFNQVANTRRAREMLAILARSGQFLPVCLTFGPTNGPEDFAFATDRVFAPGRNRKMRFCTNWQIYADDGTVRSGRCIEGVLYTDDECRDKVREAVEKQEISQQTLDRLLRKWDSILPV